MIGALITAIGGIASKVLPEVIEDKDQRNQIEAKLQQQLWKHQADIQSAASEIVKAEVSGSGLKSWWRPIAMLTFLGMLLSWWFGFTPERATPELMMKLFDLLQIGMGGYVAGRTVEKVAPHVTDTIKNRRK